MNLLRSKLAVPQVGRRLVPRPRIQALLAGVPSARVCVLSAPPGFGKTSAVLDWLWAGDRRAAWLSLDEADNDPGRLVPYLVAAISGESRTASGLAHIEIAGPAEVATGLVALLEEPEAPELLVLDDFHLISNPVVLSVVDALITRLPEHRALVLVTREDPPLRLSRVRAAGELVELRAEQLRFTEAEADAFFRERMSLVLPAEAVHALTEATEGWPAVLQLAALSLTGRPDAAARAVAIAADHRLILDYITEEVLGRLEPATVDFLERTCHLDRLTGELCDAVTGRGDGAATLERLERDNLLLVPLDDQRRWYRYHRLFAELLRLRRRHPSGPVHLAAAQWFRSRAMLADALDHAVRVDDFVGTRDLIWELGSRMLHGGEVPAVRSALDQLPGAVGRSDLGVCLLQAWACVLGGPAEDPEEWLALAGAAAEGADSSRPLAVILPGMSLMIRSLAAGSAGRRGEAIDLARQALAGGPPAAATERHAVIYRGDGLTVLGHAYWGAGDVRRAVAAYEDALPLLRTAGNWLAVAEMTANLARIEIDRGRAETALALCDQYGQRGTPADARVLLARAEALQQLGHPDVADVAATALERAKDAGDLVTITRARELGAARSAGSRTLPNGVVVSARELEVLQLIARGYSNARIAKELFVTVGTVKSHAHAIATKLATENRTETTATARRLGLVE
jgi:LuxR family maltose regulon positive regulatory protein